MYNGLYSIHVATLDGHGGKGSGVIAFQNGRIFGGDAYLYYNGSYTLAGSAFKGEVVVSQHTRALDARPLFGRSGDQPGQEVGIGVSGNFTDAGGDMNGAAFQGKQSLLFRATLKKLISFD
ncbi:MAG: GrlR family regulatory protein [Pseudomonadota bacterium]